MFHCASVGVSPAACAADKQICTRQSTDTQIQSFTPTQQQDSTLERTTFGKKKKEFLMLFVFSRQFHIKKSELNIDHTPNYSFSRSLFVCFLGELR